MKELPQRRSIYRDLETVRFIELIEYYRKRLSNRIPQLYQATLCGWDTTRIIHSERTFDMDKSAAGVGTFQDPSPYPESDPLDSNDDPMYDVQREGLFRSPSSRTLLNSGSPFCSTTSHKLAPLAPKDFANSQIEQPHDMILRPSTEYTISESSTVVVPEPSACRRLISRAFVPREIISLIEAIFTSEAETDIVGDLRGEDAQTFIDLVHEVRL